MIQTFRTAGCLVVGMLLLSFSSFGQTNFATLVSDGGWCWFSDPRALFHNGMLYFGCVRSDGHSTLNLFNLQTGKMTNLWVSSLTEFDDHDVCGLQVRQDNTLLALWSRHGGDTFFSYRQSTSTNPVSPADWGPEQQANTVSGTTYCNPYQLSAEGGEIYSFSRDLNYNPTVFTSSDNGATWSAPTWMIRTGTGSTRPYVKYCSNYTNRIDILYTDAHPDNYTTSLYEMYYQGGAFHQTDGTFMTNFADLPILHDAGQRGSVVYQYNAAATVDPNQWISTARAWCWEIAYQTNGAPVCVFQTKVDAVTGSTWADARIYYYYARWTGTNWQKRFIAQAGRPLYNGQPDYGGGMGLDPQDVNTIYISSDASNPFDLSTTTSVPLGNHYEIYKGVTADGGLTFTWSAITTNSSVDNCRPYVPRRFGGEPCVLWWRGTYNAYTSFYTSIVGLFTTAVPVPVVVTNPPIDTTIPTVRKANNASNLNLTNSWLGGIAPGAGNVAAWDSTVTALNSVALGGNLSWSGITVTNPGGAVNITAGNTLTLGSSGINLSAATANLTISSGLTLGAGNEIWSVTNGRTLALNTGIFSRSDGATLNVQGTGTTSSGMTGLANDTSNNGGILGPWATVGSGASTTYAALANGNISGYNGEVAVAYNTIPSSATAATNYVLTLAGSVAYGAATRTMNTLALTVGATTLTWGNSGSQINLVVNGILNSGSGTFTLTQGGSSSLSGLMIGANNNRELVLNAANAPITISARIIDSSGGASSLTVVGSSTNAVTLSGVNTYTGGTTLNAGSLILGNINGLGSSGSLIVNGGTLDLTTLSPTVGAVTINGGTIQNGTLTATSFTARNPDSAVVGAALAGVSASLTKKGPGTLILYGANTYSNGTVILDGILDYNGSVGPGAVTVTGGALAGTGTIGGAVTVQPGGTLAPGNNAIGTLTIDNALTNTGTIFMLLNKSGTTLTSSTITGISTFSANGTLSVSNISDGIMTAGDSFKLFSATTYKGAFTTISPATPGTGLAWDTTKLTLNGTLSVIATVPPQFITITSQGNGSFLLTGTGAAGVNYELDAATNLLPPVVWSSVSNAIADQSGTFQFVDVQTASFSQRFYRIKSEQ